jgi:hypothetical protein
MSTIAPDRGGRNSLAYVYDGQQCLDHVLSRGKAWRPHPARIAHEASVAENV